jgi:KaiC/GvpD/RAD55 family RecA-like ATPase
MVRGEIMGKDIFLRRKQLQVEIESLKEKIEDTTTKINYLKRKISNIQFLCSHENAVRYFDPSMSPTVDHKYRYMHYVQCPDCGISILTDDESIYDKYKRMQEEEVSDYILKYRRGIENG